MEITRKLIACLEDYVECANNDGIVDFNNDYICHHICQWSYDEGMIDDEYLKLIDEFRLYAPNGKFMPEIWNDPRCFAFKGMGTSVPWFDPIKADEYQREEYYTDYTKVNELRLKYVKGLIEFLKQIV